MKEPGTESVPPDPEPLPPLFNRPLSAPGFCLTLTGMILGLPFVGTIYGDLGLEPEVLAFAALTGAAIVGGVVLMARSLREPPRKRLVQITLPGVIAIALASLVITAVAIPNHGRGHSLHGNETSAVGALKTIAVAQMLFRESDRDEDGNLDYGTLAELAAPRDRIGLIDAVLGSGTKRGYLFEATYSSTTPEFLWMATARPIRPSRTGRRYFATNHEGTIYYTSSAPFRLDARECAIPKGSVPLGR